MTTPISIQKESIKGNNQSDKYNTAQRSSGNVSI